MKINFINLKEKRRNHITIFMMLIICALLVTTAVYAAIPEDVDKTAASDTSSNAVSDSISSSLYPSVTALREYQKKLESDNNVFSEEEYLEGYYSAIRSITEEEYFDTKDKIAKHEDLWSVLTAYLEMEYDSSYDNEKRNQAKEIHDRYLACRDKLHAGTDTGDSFFDGFLSDDCLYEYRLIVSKYEYQHNITDPNSELEQLKTDYSFACYFPELSGMSPYWQPLLAENYDQEKDEYYFKELQDERLLLLEKMRSLKDECKALDKDLEGISNIDDLNKHIEKFNELKNKIDPLMLSVAQMDERLCNMHNAKDKQNQ